MVEMPNPGTYERLQDEDYKDMLKTTMNLHRQQNGKKGAYEVHPDNQMSLWNMIESYKNERHDLKQVQIA